jgi:hypothetical protein
VDARAKEGMVLLKRLCCLGGVFWLAVYNLELNVVRLKPDSLRLMTLMNAIITIVGINLAMMVCRLGVILVAEGNFETLTGTWRRRAIVWPPKQQQLEMLKWMACVTIAIAFPFLARLNVRSQMGVMFFLLVVAELLMGILLDLAVNEIVRHLGER